MVNHMRFGVNISPAYDWLKLAQLSERIGLKDVWLPADMAYNDSFSAIGYAVAKTKKIRFFPYANSVYLRHPVLLASGVANIDKEAPGRVGAAYSSAGIETSVNLDIPDEDPVQACLEAIEITRLIWTGKPVNYQGKHWVLKNVNIPLQAREGIPQRHVGRRRRRRTLPRLARHLQHNHRGSQTSKGTHPSQRLLKRDGQTSEQRPLGSADQRIRNRWDTF